jgi:hypothetical protein
MKARLLLKRILAILAASVVCSAAYAQLTPYATPDNNNDFLGTKTIRLWPGDAPEAKGKACEDIPTLTVFESSGGGSGKGSAVIIMPSGGYSLLTGKAGLGKGDQALDQWPNLLETWLCAQGLLTPAKHVAGAKP